LEIDAVGVDDVVRGHHGDVGGEHTRPGVQLGQTTLSIGPIRGDALAGTVVIRTSPPIADSPDLPNPSGQKGTDHLQPLLVGIGFELRPEELSSNLVHVSLEEDPLVLTKSKFRCLLLDAAERRSPSVIIRENRITVVLSFISPPSLPKKLLVAAEQIVVQDLILLLIAGALADRRDGIAALCVWLGWQQAREIRALEGFQLGVSEPSPGPGSRNQTPTSTCVPWSSRTCISWAGI